MNIGGHMARHIEGLYEITKEFEKDNNAEECYHTHYLSTYKCTARELAQTMIKDVLANTGITATAGIGTNMYLAKIAMDITAKKMPADENGVRIAELDEMSYRKELWTHKPLTDFWMLGSGIAKRGV